MDGRDTTFNPRVEGSIPSRPILKDAQQAIDLEPERFKHYYLRELPERYHGMFDPRLAGPGERIVFQPYTREIFERTYRWVRERGLFAADAPGSVPFTEAIVG